MAPEPHGVAFVRFLLKLRWKRILNIVFPERESQRNKVCRNWVEQKFIRFRFEVTCRSGAAIFFCPTLSSCVSRGRHSILSCQCRKYMWPMGLETCIASFTRPLLRSCWSGAARLHLQAKATLLLLCGRLCYGDLV